MIDLDAENSLVEQYRSAWLVERDKLNATLKECAASHHSPPNNYWEKEYRARNKFMMAARVFTVLEGL